MAKPMSMIPSVFTHAESIGLSSQGSQVLAWIQVTSHPTLIHKSLWALQNFFVKVPLKAWAAEQRLVARVQFDAWSTVLQESLGQDLYVSQDLPIQILEQQGLVSQVPLNDLKHCFSWNGQSLQLYPVSENLILCQFQVHMQEPKQWPVTKLPVGPRRAVIKQAIGLIHKTSGSLHVESVIICLGPQLHGNQRDWRLLDISDTSYTFLVGRSSPLQKVSVDRLTGFSKVIDEWSFEDKWTLQGPLIRVPACQSPWPETQLGLCSDVFHGISRQHLIFISKSKSRVIEEAFSKLDHHRSQTSVALGDLERFQISFTFKGSMYISTYEWSTLLQRLNS